MNQLFYDFAVWVDGFTWSTMLHESYYMYNWIETTHVLTLMVSLGLLFVTHLRTLGLIFTDIPATQITDRLRWPMLVGFAVMMITGLLLFYAIPVRTAQSLWFRIKLVLLVVLAVNALLFHWQLGRTDWDGLSKAPRSLRLSAVFSTGFWIGVVICGRFIAYDWFDCDQQPGPVISTLAGCLPGQEQF